MTQQHAHHSEEVLIDPKDEELAVQKLRAYLIGLKQANIEKNIEELFTLEGGFLDRLNFFLPHLNERAMKRLLVSGCAVASELIAALQHGFEEAYGTEVTAIYAEVANLRVAGNRKINVTIYDGSHLPYEDNFFTTLTSGHVIEHTPSPYKYFKEHMRVLEKGGFFFLEFPERYHSIELHTGLKSYEWLPTPLRSWWYRFLSSPLSLIEKEKRKYYDLIRRTLRPVSLWQLKLFLLLSGNFSSKVVAVQRPAPGFLQVLIQK